MGINRVTLQAKQHINIKHTVCLLSSLTYFCVFFISVCLEESCLTAL